jgi:hypothetical protein
VELNHQMVIGAASSQMMGDPGLVWGHGQLAWEREGANVSRESEKFSTKFVLCFASNGRQGEST